MIRRAKPFAFRHYREIAASKLPGFVFQLVISMIVANVLLIGAKFREWDR